MLPYKATLIKLDRIQPQIPSLVKVKHFVIHLIIVADPIVLLTLYPIGVLLRIHTLMQCFDLSQVFRVKLPNYDVFLLEAALC